MSVEIDGLVGAAPNTQSLYLVQDRDAPYYVIAANFTDAIDKWKQRIVAESDGQESLLDLKLLPQGVAFVAGPDELIR